MILDGAHKTGISWFPANIPGSIITLQVNPRSVIKMKGRMLFSLGLMMLLLALSCNAAPKKKGFFGFRRRPIYGHRRPFHPPTPRPEPYDSCQGHGYQYDECGRRCICNRGHLKDCTRIRKEFISMSQDDRVRYIRAVKKVSTDPRYKLDYESLLQMHYHLFYTDIHKKKHFLTWHRWFVLQYENLLQKVDCRVTAAYWDWTASNPFDTSDDGVWNSKDFGFGGNGSGNSLCVQTGPFKEGWKLLPPSEEATNPDCLARNFTPVSQVPREEDLQELLNIPASDFTEFECRHRACLHNMIHYNVGGTMVTNNSAAAPEFFLHHSMVDKIWNDWQKKGDEYKNAYFPTVHQLMPCTNKRPKEFIDLSNLPGGVRVEYEECAVASRRGQSLNERHRVRRALPPWSERIPDWATLNADFKCDECTA